MICPIKLIPYLIGLIFASESYADHYYSPEVKVINSKDASLPSTANPIMEARDLIRLRSNTSDSAKLLEDFAGVSIYGAGGVSSLPSIHGLADDRIRIKVDGMDLISGCANHMNSPLSYIDPSNISSIKVYSGITPVSVGGDSIAGSIVVESAVPEFADSADKYLLKGQLGTFYRSNNNARGANMSAVFATDSFSARYTASTVEANNFHAGGNFHTSGYAWQNSTFNIKGPWLKGDEVGSSSFKSSNQSLGLAFKSGEHLFELKLDVQQIPYQGFPNQRMDMTLNRSERGQVKYTGIFDWGKLQFAAYHDETQHSMNFGEDKLLNYGMMANRPILGMPMETSSRNTGLSGKADFILSSKDLLKVGAEYQRYRLNDYWPAVANSMMMGPNDFQNINNGKRDRADIFAEWEHEFSREWQTQAGVRLSRISMDSDDVHGYGMMDMAAANKFNSKSHQATDYNLDTSLMAKFISDETRFYEFGYAMKNRSPSLYERNSWSYNSSMNMNMVNWIGDGNGYVGNKNLDKETAHTLSATVDMHSVDLTNRVRVTPYYTYIDDYVAAVPCSNIYGVCASRTDGFSNLSLDNQKARIYGLDISGVTVLGSLDGLGEFKMRSQVSYTRGKNITTGDDLYNIMPLNAKFALDHKYGQWSNLLELKMVASKDQVDDVRKEIQTSGFSIMNFYSSYDWEKFRLDFGIENMFDRKYENPLGGAYLGQGKTMASDLTAPQYGTVVPGMGRSLNIGLLVKF